ncbi:hypothetical protein ILS93_06525 [Bacillus sp. 16GRE42]|uniref:LPO_1073/Vpar_1526 family protein n=1 Tax=Bacillus sp. 16GRE42 TaxID=2778092 RepID=UPI001C9BBBCD|nr:LPO_1073/Vpar_1526 family protein [Bacillus sp. 16GRE42]MBY7121764.1 hypothetical protein [Bacillus sp. 16GRE42]
MNDRQELTAGDYSNNIQAQKAIVNQYGLSYENVERVAMNVFKSNFYDLGDKVDKLVNERAEEIINKYLKQLKETNAAAIANTQDPDLRFVIYEAQKNYVRLGDKEISDLLVDMLVNRTIEQNESFMKLVLNESLAIIPKLTIKQIDILSLIFIFNYARFNEMPFEEYYPHLHPFIQDIPTNDMFYQHLQYAGCLSISIGSCTYESIMSNRFPYLFKEGIDYDEAVKDLNSLNPNLNLFMDRWNNTELCHSSLTSVGMAIAYTNLKRKVKISGDLSNWIHE